MCFMKLILATTATALLARHLLLRYAFSKAINFKGEHVEGTPRKLDELRYPAAFYADVLTTYR